MSATLLAGQVSPTTVVTLNPDAIAHDSGHSYRVRITSRAVFPWSTPSDWSGAERRSKLVLYEDGERLAPAHQYHERIRAEGGGGYSHWGRVLLFSTSDGSDPRTNGRQYRVEQQWQVHPALPPLVLGFAITAALSSMLAGIPLRQDAPTAGRLTAESRAGVWATGVLAAVVLTIVLAAPSFNVRLKNWEIAAVDGQGWQVVISPLVQFPFAVLGDSPSWPTRSRLILEEDGHPLGPAHSAHSVISDRGGGAFSHWGQRLLFSTTDGSDPRSNGRVYHFKVRAGVAPSLLWLLFSVGALTALTYLNRLSPAARQFLVRGNAGGCAHWAALVLAAAIAAALLLTVGKWAWAQTTTVSAAGYVPLSDAHGYWHCARQIASFGIVTEYPDWCAGRITYSAMLASLIALSGWQPHLVYLFQAVLVAVAIAALILPAARQSGAIGGLVVAVLLLMFATEHVLGTTMTEVAGFTAGTAALALLLFGAERRRPWPIFAGLALLAVALVARAGAMFILPALLLWAMLVAPSLGLRRRRAAAVAAGALLVGSLLQFTVVVGLRLNSDATFANFSTVLYGLASGGKGWNYVYEAHPEVFAEAFAGGEPGASIIRRSAQADPDQLAAAYRRVYGLAFARIYAEPGVFIAALVHQVQSFWRYYFDLRPLAPGVWPPLKWLVLLGLSYCLWRGRSPAGTLMIAWAVGEAASAALLADGGMRIFAASVGGRFVLVALGVSVLLRLLLRAWTGPAPTSLDDARTHWPVPALAAVAGGAVVVLALLPVLHLLPFGRLPHLPPHLCPDGQVAVVTRVDRESPTLTLVANRDATGVYPLRVEAKQLLAGMGRAWFAQDFAAIPPGTMLVSAMNRVAPGASAALAIPQAPGWLRPGVTIGACVDPRDWFTVAERRYYKVVSVNRLPIP